MIVMRSLLFFIALETFTVCFANASLNAEQQTTFDECSMSIINSKLIKCGEHLQEPVVATGIPSCRQQQAFLACSDDVLKNCPLVMKMVQPLVDTAKAAFETQCPHLSLICPQTIQNGREDIIDYCIKDVTEILPTDSNYCTEMRTAIECIPAVKELCPPNPYPLMVDGVSEMLYDIMVGHCGPVENKRSTDYSSGTKGRSSTAGESNVQ